MARPLMQHGVGQLEEMFAKAKADPKVLKQLENELQYRQVPRAVALLAEVQAAMYSAPLATSPVVPAPLPKSPAAPIDVPPVVVPVRPPAVPTIPVTAVTPPKQQPTTPNIPLELAYKLLRATPASTWESVEQTRRQLVQQSHPARMMLLSQEQCIHALAEAKRVNGAYLALSHSRCWGR